MIFLIGLIPLLYFSWTDIKKQELSNLFIFLYALISVSVLFFNQINIMPIIFLCLINFLIFFLLWTKKAVGGADVKLIPFLTIYILILSPNIYVGFWFFLVFLLILGTIYSIISKIIIKNKEIPFIPLITLTYIFFYVFIIFGQLNN